MRKRKNGLKNKFIGVFDSGIGGLTVFKEIRRLLPKENIVYFGDTARVPYGTKSPETIKKFASEIASFLKNYNLKAVVVACNTVSSIALKEVNKSANVPVVGVIKPGAVLALESSKRGKIAVIGTTATVSSKAYEKELKKIASVKVKQKACPLLVPLVEEGWADSDVTDLVLKRYLKDLKTGGYDTLILGCTHYPVIKSKIAEHLPNMKIIDSAKAVAGFLKNKLQKLDIVEKNGRGKSVFIVSDAPDKFRRLAWDLIGIKVSDIMIKRF